MTSILEKYIDKERVFFLIMNGSKSDKKSRKKDINANGTKTA